MLYIPFRNRIIQYGNSNDLTDKEQEQRVELRNAIGYSSVDDFHILRKIGEGTYSSVFKVRRNADDQIYALKKIKLDNMNKKSQENALNEVRILASINHENIISFRQTFYQKGCLFLILQYADNGDLLHEIHKRNKERQHFSQMEIWLLLIQVLLGLNTLHNRNILHRDIKPANIFLTKQGVPKLGDLNVSKIVNTLCQTQTGTPYYASPQIWKDEPYDKKSDIWSLGCSVYQMATLFPPFFGEDLQTVYNQITQASFSPLPYYYSKQLQKLLQKMMQKQPRKRCSAQYILRNIDKIIPDAYKNLSIVQKVKNLFHKKCNKHASSIDLLKTITFPSRKTRRDNQLNANSYLPSPSYSRDHSRDQMLNSSIAASTINVSLQNQLKKLKKNTVQKGISLYGAYDKQNGACVFKKNKEPIEKIKRYRLPQIKAKASKK